MPYSCTCFHASCYSSEVYEFIFLKKVVGGQLIEPGSHRTNNHVDSWHRKFSTKARSEVFELVEMFKQEQADTLTSPHSHLHGCL